MSDPDIREKVGVFIGTKKIRRHSTSIAIVLEKQWGFEKYDLITVSLKKAINDGTPGIKATKRVSAIGNSSVIFCDKEWGFKVGDWAYMSVRRFTPKTPEPPIVETEDKDKDVHDDIIEKVIVDDIGI